MGAFEEYHHKVLVVWLGAATQVSIHLGIFIVWLLYLLFLALKNTLLPKFLTNLQTMNINSTFTH